MDRCLNRVDACGALRRWTASSDGQPWVLATEGRFKVLWMVLGPLGILLVSNLRVQVVGGHAVKTDTTKGDGFSDEIHTVSATLAYMACIGLELYQLVVGEGMFRNKLGCGLQRGRFACAVIACVGVVTFVSMRSQTWVGSGVIEFIGEVGAGTALTVDFLLLSYSPAASSILEIRREVGGAM